MARYRKILPGYWRDEKVRALQDLEDKAIGLYILTAQSNRIGCFVFSLALAAEDLELPAATFSKRFTNVIRTLKWEYDEAARVLYVPSWWKTNPPENPNNMIGNLSDIEEVPDSHLVARFCANVSYLSGNVLSAFRQTLLERYPQRMATQEQEQEQELKQEQDKNKAKAIGVAESPPPAEIVGSIPHCPHESIIAAWHEAMPDLPKVKLSRWPGSVSERNLRSRWREGLSASSGFWRFATAEDGVARARELFKRCRDSEFLMGRASAGNGHSRSFVMDLHWLLDRKNFDKVLSNRYHAEVA